MRIDEVELDDDNIAHVTRHGVTIAEIEQVFRSGPVVFRNRGGRSGDYYVIAHGIRINFLYRPGVVRPISAWRVP